MGDEALKPENVINEDPKPRQLPKKETENQVDTYERGLKEGIELGKKIKAPEKAPEPQPAPSAPPEKKKFSIFSFGDM